MKERGAQRPAGAQWGQGTPTAAATPPMGTGLEKRGKRKVTEKRPSLLHSFQGIQGGPVRGLPHVLSKNSPLVLRDKPSQVKRSKGSESNSPRDLIRSRKPQGHRGMLKATQGLHFSRLEKARGKAVEQDRVNGRTGARPKPGLVTTEGGLPHSRLRRRLQGVQPDPSSNSIITRRVSQGIGLEIASKDHRVISSVLGCKLKDGSKVVLILAEDYIIRGGTRNRIEVERKHAK